MAIIKIKGIKNIEFFAKGKRGIICIGKYKNKKIAIKIKNPKSFAINRIQNEAKWLKILNKYNIGPKLLFFKNKKLAYEFVDGEFIIDYVKNNSKNNTIKILQNIFNQLFILDKLKINKEEMHRPVKHIIVTKNNKPILIDAQKSKISGISKTAKAVLIDFERTHRTEKPHNVTQFCQFLISKNVSDLLKKKGIKIDKKKIINLAKNYKEDISKKNLNIISNSFR